MFKVEEIDKQIVRIHQVVPHFTKEMWQQYQEMILKLLEDSEKQLYILSDFQEMQSFDPEIASEVGTAKHLSHPKLGMIVLLGGNTLSNFILVLTENRATRTKKSDTLRIHKDYDRALEILQDFRDSHHDAHESDKTVG